MTVEDQQPVEPPATVNYLVARNDDFARELAKHILITFDEQGVNVESLGGYLLDPKVLK